MGDELAEWRAATLQSAAGLFSAGKLDEAAKLYRELAQAGPEDAVASANLGAVLHAQGRYMMAVAELTRALKLAPDQMAVQHQLAVCLGDWGVHLQRARGLKDAVALYRKALMLDEALPEVRRNMGAALLEQGDTEGAIACFEAARALEPASAETAFSLANAVRAAARLDDALAVYREALALDPAHVPARLNLGAALLEQGALDDALTELRDGVARAPGLADAHSNYLMALAYDPGCTADVLKDAARAVGAALPAPAGPPPARDLDPERRLRVGYVSPDFRFHPVGWFIQAPLVHHDRARFDVVCYADQREDDELTALLRGHANHWHVIAGQSDDAFAALVEKDRIDILIDLAGHTAHNRLAALARRMAPIQASWIGFPMTTGVPAIDYVIADPRLAPPGSEPEFTETVLRLPDVAWCYTPPVFAPALGASRAAPGKDGAVTFGSFNNPAKLNPALLATWAEILARVPGSRLLIKYRHLDGGGAARRLRAAAEAAGIAPERLILEGRSPHPEALAAYARVDVALDPFPFNGGTTTCEALWMHVPVITLAGATMAGRLGASLIGGAGLGELIATDPADYVTRAVALATDRRRLAALRAELRERVAVSPLCDGRRFGAALDAALREIWRRHCAGHAPGATP